jgi:hypothetical protein
LSDHSDHPDEDEDDYEKKGGWFRVGGISVSKQSAMFRLLDTQQGLASLVLLKKGKVH